MRFIDLYVHQACDNGIPDEIDDVTSPELPHDIAPMDLHRPSGSVKRRGNLSVGVALQNEMEHPSFDLRQGFRWQVAGRGMQGLVHRREQAIHLRGPLEAIGRAGFHGLDCRIDSPGFDERDDRQPRRNPLGLGQQIESFVCRLVDIGDKKPTSAVVY
jgi:hypothetical protein